MEGSPPRNSAASREADLENELPAAAKDGSSSKDELTELTPLVGHSASSRGLVQYFQNLQYHFGCRLLVLLFVVQHLLKGFSYSLVGQATPYLYRSFGVPAPQMQIFSGISQLPWAMKPIIGLVSDVFPIAGYNKAPYMLMASVVGVFAFLYLGLLPHGAISVQMVVLCMFLISLQTSTCDLISEAKYAQKMQAAPQHGPALLSYVWFGSQVGGLVAIFISGWLVHSGGPQVPFVLAAVPAIAVLFPVAYGYLEERVVTPNELTQVRQKFAAQPEACFLCLLIFVGSAVLMVVGLVWHDPLVNCVAALSVAMVMLVSFSVTLSPVVAKFNAFSLIQSALAVPYGGASFYFYTDTKDMYPEGPHFSEFFFNSVMGTVGALFSLVGVYLYQRYMGTWKYRELLIVTNLILSAFAALDILMFARVNIKFGIPDRALVLGLSVVESIVGSWQWMPQVVILSYLCPRGMEATMYALLAGCHNLGNTIASSLGALLLQRLGCQPSGQVGESDQFQMLWVAATVSTVLPMIAILVLYRLIPDARQNEQIVDSSYDATTGSVWRRYVHGDQ
jgi:folate/biopterin transporter